MLATLILALVLSLLPGEAGGQRPAAELQAIAAILAIEDARGGDAGLVNALKRDPPIARAAIRALGRLERPALVDVLIPQLLSPDPSIRREAATAIGQALTGRDPQKPALLAKAIDALTALLGQEADFDVRGVVCETLGRLPFHSVERHRAIERLLVANTRLTTAPSGVAAFFMPGVVSAAKGLESLIRLHQKSAAPEPATAARLRELVAEPLPATAAGAAPTSGMRAQDGQLRQTTRELAMQALIAGRAVDRATIKAARADDPTRRPSAVLLRQSITALTVTEGVEDAEALIAESARDPSDEVRYEAIRVYAPRREVTGCRLLFDALDDRSPHVTLLAIDAIDTRCPHDESLQRLNRLVESLSAVRGDLRIGPAKDAPVPLPAWNGGSRLRLPGTWHAPAHAIVSLAKLSPDAVKKALPDFVAHDTWQVRMYAARAAAVLNDGDLLAKLAADGHDNVREAAITALSRVRAHEADALYRQALQRPDYQLIRTAAEALEGTPQREQTATVVLQALKRLTAERRDTSRDPRMALLQRLREVGGATHVAELRAYLTDFDPRVAALAAELITAWTGDATAAKPQPLPLPAPPTVEELDSLPRLRALIVMRGGGVLELAFKPDDAPLAATRFVRLARAGYFNGLTFHRVAPNFVIQGGSPGANEYMGDGPYMRDEVGQASNAARSVGVSTRGRDTGDAQIYVNLIDNWRLDHDYTVFATVERGIYTLYDIIEGDVMDRVDIVSR